MSGAPLIDVRPVGDSAIIVQYAVPGAPEPSTDDLLRARRLLAHARIPGVTEITTAFTTVALFYDPAQVAHDGGASIFANLEARIRAALADDAAPPVPDGAAEARDVEIPICCDPEFSLDLADVAASAQLQPSEVIQFYTAAEYQVACVGFTPGFPYLAGLPTHLATPRRATPRTAVPAGSVAIGGSQAGIYPIESPGGWNVIGRTPLRLFHPVHEPPSALRAGDRVRFREITRAEYDDPAVNPQPIAVQAPANK